MENENATLQNVLINVERLINYAKSKLYLEEEDIIYTRNLLLDALSIKTAPYCGDTEDKPIQEILDNITEYAVQSKLIDPLDRILFETKIMGIVTPPPSKVIRTFDSLAGSKGVATATNYLYDISVASNYIRKVDIDKNIKWDYDGELGKIKITINLSKPEKDPKEVERAKNAPAGYPKCLLCQENVGYAGHAGHPARQTLRTIPIKLNDEDWFMQYSPYVYFDQHLIAISEEHRPMDLNAASFERMLDFVELFPHYFIGSNAPLPIVGGSILAHDHYQGGKKVLPMLDAQNEKHYVSPKYSMVNFMTVKWYNSVIKLESKNRAQLVKAAMDIFEKWKGYSDESVNIIASSEADGKIIPHNTVTPVAYINRDGEYTIAMVLRNNRTDAAHPFGIFHPSEELHNIKKESIGIIEVMGLFVLPGRLSKEAMEIKDILTGAIPLDFKSLADDTNPMHKHLGMIAQLTADYGTSLSEEKASEAVTNYINTACEKILKTTAVFKRDDAGRAAFEKFIQYALN